MYVRGKISDLTPIDIPEVEDFIISPLNEIDYFKCKREDLVSLKNYLLELKEKKKKYDSLIAEPLKSIQEKNTWCKDVQPAIGDIYFMKVQAKNYPSVFIGEYDNSFVGSGIAYDSLDPRGFIYDKENMALLEQIKTISIETIESNIHNNYADYVKIRNEIREKIGAYLYKETGSKPVILTVIQEIEV